MSMITQKRPLPAKVAKMQARKRQKLNEPDEANKKTTKGTASTKPVKLDELRWDSVAIPDALDDYEGFFGLEEIDGVDVVRNDGGDKVTYVFADGTRVGGGAKIVEKEEVSNGKDDGDIDEEWGGFDDDTKTNGPDAVDEEKPKITKSAKDKKVKDKKKKNDKNGKDANTKNLQSTKSNNDISPNNLTSFDLLTNATDNSEDADISAWRKLHLSPEVTSALSQLKFSTPTQIQSSAIPEILAGHDLIGKAPTGSGKTLAFGIPIYEHWLSLRESTKRESKDVEKSPSALIVLPTRELAHQIAKHLSALCNKTEGEAPVIATLTGGLSIQKQRRILAHADIVIGTPGRLWEVISEGQGILSAFKSIKFLVLDEADRLLSDGHFKELEDLLTALNRSTTTIDANGNVDNDESNTSIAARQERQTLIFSATFSKGLQQKLAKRTHRFKGTADATNQASMEYLLDKLSFREEQPCFIDVNPAAQMATNLREGLVECPGPEKDLYLYALLLYHPSHRALVFVNSISAVRRLVPFLVNLGLNALPLHSQMVQKARLRSIERFSPNTKNMDKENAVSNSNIGPSATHGAPILVATDVAARGLDIQHVGLVLHYHLPRAADTYVHRSGRTARANNTGSSILLCAPEEASGLRRLVAQVHASEEAKPHKRKHAALKPLDVDPRVIAALRPRAALSKRIADSEGAKEKGRKEDNWMRAAAEDLGVDEDEVQEMMDDEGKTRGRGKGRKQREVAAKGMSKEEVGGLKEELRGLLKRRVNVGVSERYLTSNAGLDVDALLRMREQGGGAGLFLGEIGGLGLEDE